MANRTERNSYTVGRPEGGSPYISPFSRKRQKPCAYTGLPPIPADNERTQPTTDGRWIGMKVHGFRCPTCGFYHDQTRAAQQESGLKIQCVDCGWIETVDTQAVKP